MIRIMIADDHQLFTDGIRSILGDVEDISLVAQAANGEEVLRLVKECTPDIILMDVNMPVMNGLEATKVIKADFPAVKIIVLTMYNSWEFIEQILATGAEGYILKNTGKEELISAITTVYEGSMYYGDEVTATMMRNYARKKEAPKEQVKLSRREIEVLQLIVQELTAQEIANKLFISQYTVDTHRKNLLSKLNVRNTAGLVKYALQNGLLEA